MRETQFFDAFAFDFSKPERATRKALKTAVYRNINHNSAMLF